MIMENYVLKVLWIDDEHKELTGLKGRAKRNGIELIPFKSYKGGINELERNYILYDGVLLDAKILENEEDTPGTENTRFVHRAKDRLLQLPKKFKIFVLTGQGKAYGDETFNEVFENVYKKGSDEDIERLFIDIKAFAECQPLSQIKHENSKFFRILENYNPDASKTFIKIFQGIRLGGEFFDDQDQFTQLRIIIEELFRKANAICLLHDKCIHSGRVHLTDASLFLAGMDTKYSNVKCLKPHFPKIIAINIKNILEVTGAASHFADIDITQNINIQKYRNDINTPYLLLSLANQLMDIIIWFENYSSKNSNIETNKSLWQDIDYDTNGKKYFTGYVERIASNGWGTIKIEEEPYSISIHKDTVKSEGIEEQDKITFTFDTKHYLKNIKEVKPV